MIIRGFDEINNFENELIILYNKFLSEINNNLVILPNPQLYLKQLLEKTNKTLFSIKNHALNYNFDHSEYKAFHFLQSKRKSSIGKTTINLLQEKLSISMNHEFQKKYYSLNLNEIEIDSVKLEINEVIERYNDLKLKFIYDLQINLENLVSFKSKSTKSKIAKTFNSNIFKNNIAQSIFYNTLLHHKAIDENNYPIKRRFLPICAAIYNKNSKFFNEIFTYKLPLNKYVCFLEEEFKYPIKDKSKVSSSYIHYSKVKEFILSSLNLAEIKSIDQNS